MFGLITKESNRMIMATVHFSSIENVHTYSNTNLALNHGYCSAPMVATVKKIVIMDIQLRRSFVDWGSFLWSQNN